jgi:hypothetical protein
MMRDPAGVGSGLQNQVAEFDSQAHFQDKWVLWPNDCMAPLDEIDEYEWLSDDYEIVVVTEYDESDSPCKWYRYASN